MKIRQEEVFDYAEIYELVKLSFATTEHGDGTEADYLNDIRKKDTFIPELSLVAETEGGKLIGQIVLYKTDIVTSENTLTELVLSPICVHPDYFLKGIARTMIKKSFDIARSLGYSSVFLCGDPDIYHKMGFIPTYKYKIYHIDDIEKNAEWCMVCELYKGSLKGITGTIDIM